MIGPFKKFPSIVRTERVGEVELDGRDFVRAGSAIRAAERNDAEGWCTRTTCNDRRRRSASVSLIYALNENGDEEEEDDEEEDEEEEEGNPSNKKQKKRGRGEVFANDFRSGSSDYKIDNKAVTFDRYADKLKQFGILVKARNFLVFQGDIEAVAQKSPKDLTQLFEQLSGGDELKQAY